MPYLNRLREEHENLMAIAGRLSGMIAQNVPPPSHDLYVLRKELASALIHHLKSEDWVLYPRLLVSSNRCVAETARAFSEEMGGLATTFRDYAERWGAHAIECDWKRYRRETAEILETLAQRMMREDRDLYPLLETPEKVAA